MSQYDIYESVDGCFDIFAEVDFLQSLKMEELADLLQLVSKLLTEGLESNRFEGLVSLQVSLEKVSLRLRYYQKPKLLSLGIEHTGYEQPEGLSYLFYFFAIINKQFSIGKHPLPIKLQDYEDYPW